MLCHFSAVMCLKLSDVICVDEIVLYQRKIYRQRSWPCFVIHKSYRYYVKIENHAAEIILKINIHSSRKFRRFIEIFKGLFCFQCVICAVCSICHLSSLDFHFYTIYLPLHHLNIMSSKFVNITNNIDQIFTCHK